MLRQDSAIFGHNNETNFKHNMTEFRHVNSITLNIRQLWRSIVHRGIIYFQALFKNTKPDY